MNLRVLSWNARGLNSNLDQLVNYLKNSLLDPDIICVQETFMIGNNIVIPGYIGIFEHQIIRKGGGVAMFIK